MDPAILRLGAEVILAGKADPHLAEVMGVQVCAGEDFLDVFARRFGMDRTTAEEWFRALATDEGSRAVAALAAGAVTSAVN